LKLLLVGAESQVGRALTALLKDKAVTVVTLGNAEVLDTSLAVLATRFGEQQFQFIVNVDHIDGFRTEGFTQRELEQRHVWLPQQLAKLAEMLRIPLLQLSDYQVFSGMHDKPYREDDEPHAQTLYGATRWQGELAVQRSTHRLVILRVGTIFCLQGRNVLTVLLDHWKQGKARELSTTLQFSPTPTSDVARVIYAILQQLECNAQAWGVYHYCSADIASPYDFAEVLLAARTQFHGIDNEICIKPVQGTLPKAKHKSRPMPPIPINTVLVCEKILNTFGIRQRPWRGELTRMVKGAAKTATK
jgi:dTDP-4-dehydrorhamnose reductase